MRPHRFYVTVVKGERVGRLAGPFRSYLEAEAHLPAVRREADRIDPWAHSYGFGVSKWADDAPGSLNGRLGLDDDGRPEQTLDR